jgi:hypothetical protein
MFVVYKKSPGGCRVNIMVFEHEIEAADWCDQQGWELQDENGFVWDLDYREV